MCRQNHGVAVDYYALGVIAYECMMGKVNYFWKMTELNKYSQRPYLGRNRKEIRDQILAKQVQVKRGEIPEGWSLEAADFINRVKIITDGLILINIIADSKKASKQIRA